MGVPGGGHLAGLQHKEVFLEEVLRNCSGKIRRTVRAGSKEIAWSSLERLRQVFGGGGGRRGRYIALHHLPCWGLSEFTLLSLGPQGSDLVWRESWSLGHLRPILP